MLPTLFWRHAKKSNLLKRLIMPADKITQGISSMVMQKTHLEPNFEDNYKPGTKEYYNYLADHIPSPQDVEHSPPYGAEFSSCDALSCYLDPKSVDYRYELKSLIISSFGCFQHYKHGVDAGFDPVEIIGILEYGIIGYKEILDKAGTNPEVREDAIKRLRDMKDFLERIDIKEKKKINFYLSNINELLVKYANPSKKQTSPSPLA